MTFIILYLILQYIQQLHRLVLYHILTAAIKIENK